jgi:hypothetical protein
MEIERTNADVAMDAATVTADAAAAVKRLGELSRENETDNPMANMVAVLDLLAGEESGPLNALRELFYEGAEWLGLFEDDDADLAAERLGDAVEHINELRHTLGIVLGLIRPLAG